MITDVEQRKYDRWQKGQDEMFRKRLKKKSIMSKYLSVKLLFLTEKIKHIVYNFLDKCMYILNIK